MQKIESNNIRLSVRNLVEFVLRSGDLDNRRTASADRDAMAAGTRLHKKIPSARPSTVTWYPSIETVCFSATSAW